MQQLVFDWAEVTGTEVVDGEVRYQLGYSGEGKGLSADAPAYGPDGFISRPSTPDSDGACIARYLKDGNERVVIGAKDNRYADKVGALKAGDRAIVSKGEARVLLKDEKATVSLYTKGKQSGDSAIVEINGDKERIALVLGKLAVVLDNAENILTLTNGKTTVQLRDEGLFVNGAHFGCSTGSGHFGVFVGVNPPIPPPAPLFSVLVGPTALAAVPSSKWTFLI